MEFVQNELGRFLQEEGDAGGVSPQFDRTVFWTVNALWISILAALVIFFWKCNGAEQVQRWISSSENSDRVYATREYRRRRAREEAQKMTPEKRLAILKKAFRKESTMMVVTADALTAGCDSDTDVESGQADHSQELSVDNGHLILPIGDQGRKVPNCCAVCLGGYRVGERVVWSSNPECCHAFHEACVTDWLIKMQDGNPCPCCRQCFVVISQEDEIQEKTIRWDSHHAMDMNRVSL